MTPAAIGVAEANGALLGKPGRAGQKAVSIA